MMNRIHKMMNDRPASWSFTYCGLTGRADGAHEYNTPNNDRFEARAYGEGWDGVTCKRCLNSKFNPTKLAYRK